MKLHLKVIAFFRAISKYFSDTEGNHLYFRNISYNYILNNIEQFRKFNNDIEYNNKIISIDEYKKYIKKLGNYAGK